MDYVRENVRVILGVLYIAGGMAALLFIAWSEKRRLGGKLFSHLIADIQELPLPATIGFICIFVGSWGSFFYHWLIDPIKTDKDGNVLR